MISPKPPLAFTVVRDDEPLTHLRGAVLAIGNFDGVHRGHRAVVEAAITRGQQLGRPVAALTFEPHPRSYFRPDEPLFRLTGPETKLRLLAQLGLDGAVVMDFDQRLAAMPAEDFVQQILVERLAIAGATVGFDFHFGQGRRGSPAFLAEAGARLGFPVEIIMPLEDEGRPVSSSGIRAALSEGRVVEAAELLGHAWFISGAVQHGEKRGRELGFPTANLRLGPGCGLRHGIYAVRLGCGTAHYDGVASFGRRPTFDNGAPLLEVYLFDFAGDLYGQTLDIAFIGWIRPELRFEGIDALVARMTEDSRLARETLARTPTTTFPPPLPQAAT